MGDGLSPKETFTTEEGVLANMWVMEAIVELLERKGICTKQEVHLYAHHVPLTLVERDSRTWIRNPLAWRTGKIAMCCLSSQSKAKQAH